MGKPKKRPNSGTIDSSKLPVSVKKNVHKYKRVRTKPVLKVTKFYGIIIFTSANFLFTCILNYSMYKTKS